ncbi:MAG: GtrA family protein [Flavobacterium sp.]|nr:MAG: GtrA family protein [Flavobacterium sp.]
MNYLSNVQKVKLLILAFIDFFYPPFKKIVGRQTFRYAVCGGSNAALNLLLFSLNYNLLFTSTFVYPLGIAVTRYIASYLLALSITFPIGFLLNKYVVFQQSNLQGKVQLMRYGALTVTNIILDYSLLHLLIGYFGFWATGSQAFIIIILSLISYLFQTYYSFKTVKAKE